MIGVHVRYTQARGGLKRSIEDALSLKCNIFQIFIKTNLRWMQRTRLVEGDIVDPKDLKSIEKIFVHSIYLTNLASEDKEIREKSINSLINELEIMEKMRLDAIVLHVGYSSSLSAGIKRVSEGLNRVLDETKHMKIPVLLENSAGQKRSIASDLEHLSEIRSQVYHKDLVFFCIDTAHLYAAGYDLVPKNFKYMNDTLGRENIKLIHLNDSKLELNSRRDLHEFLGIGKIGPEKLEDFINEYRDKPFIIETPVESLDKLDEYEGDLEFVRNSLKM